MRVQAARAAATHALAALLCQRLWVPGMSAHGMVGQGITNPNTNTSNANMDAVFRSAPGLIEGKHQGRLVCSV